VTSSDELAERAEAHLSQIGTWENECHQFVRKALQNCFSCFSISVDNEVEVL
jgi:hypothetical protein